MNNIKGITVEIGGDTGPLTTALKGVNNTTRDLQGELREVNKQLKFDPTNTTLLEQKQKLLSESVTNTKTKLEALKEAEKQVQVQFEQGTIGEDKYRSLQREVIKTEDQLKNLEKQASASDVTLSKISTTAGKVGNSASKVSGAMLPATLAIVGLGAASEKLGSDLIESTNKVDVAFGKNAKGVETWSETTLDSFGIAKGTAMDMSSAYGDMATSMGLPTDKAAVMSEKLTGLAGDLASFKNIGIGEANTALSSVFTGETESLKKLGIVMTQANLQDFASSQGIKTKIADMNQAEQTQLRYNFVLDKTKSAQGDFARTSDGAANSTRVATESLKEAGETIGVMLAPIVAKAAQYISGLAKEFGGLSESTQKIILIVLAVIAAISPLAGLIQGITIIVGALTTALTFLMDNPIVLIIAGIVIAIGLLVAGFMYLWNNCEGFRDFWISLWDGIKSVTSTVVGTVIGFFTSTLPSAFNTFKSFMMQWGPLILAVFVPFIGIPLLITQHWTEIKAFFGTLLSGLISNFSAWGDDIKTFFSGLWVGIKSTVVSAWTGIKSVVNSALDGLKAVISTAFTSIKTAIMSILTPLINSVVTIFNAFKPALMTIFKGLETFFIGTWQLIKAIFLSPILLIIDLVTGNFKKMGSDVKLIMTAFKTAFTTIWNGIYLVFTGALNLIKTYCLLVWTGIVITAKTIWTSFSTFMVELWNGIVNIAVAAWNGLKSAVISIVTAIVNGAISVFNGIVNFFVSLPGTLYNLGSTAFSALRSGITSILNTIGEVVSNGFNSAINFLTGLPSRAMSWGSSFINGISSGISSVIGGIGSAVSSGFSSAISFLTALPGEAFTWGKDMIDGIVKGIKAAAGAVGKAVNGVAEDIRKFLHFSTPDEGPLVDYESWMPDFMGGLAKGINNSKSLVTNAIKGLSTDMNIGMKLTPAMAGIGPISNQGVNSNDGAHDTVIANGLTLHVDHMTVNGYKDVKKMMRDAYNIQQDLNKGKGGN